MIEKAIEEAIVYLKAMGATYTICRHSWFSCSRYYSFKGRKICELVQDADGEWCGAYVGLGPRPTWNSEPSLLEAIQSLVRSL